MSLPFMPLPASLVRKITEPVPSQRDRLLKPSIIFIVGPIHLGHRHNGMSPFFINSSPGNLREAVFQLPDHHLSLRLRLGWAKANAILLPEEGQGVRAQRSNRGWHGFGPDQARLRSSSVFSNVAMNVKTEWSLLYMAHNLAKLTVA